MLDIDLEMPSKIIGGYLVVYGKTLYENQNIKICCYLSQSFLEDISNGSTEYFQTFKNNKWTIEMLAENKLSTNRDIEDITEGKIITILASDKSEFDSLN